MDQHHLNRIQFLSRRFNELQGLRVAFTGLCIAVGLGIYLAAAARPTDNGAMIALLVSFVPPAASLRCRGTSSSSRQTSAGRSRASTSCFRHNPAAAVMPHPCRSRWR
jgi:hypothetical protein